MRSYRSLLTLLILTSSLSCSEKEAAQPASHHRVNADSGAPSGTDAINGGAINGGAMNGGAMNGGTMNGAGGTAHGGLDADTPRTLDGSFGPENDGGSAVPSSADGGYSGGLMRLSAYEPAAGQPGSTAVAKDDPRIVAWATGYVAPVAFGTDADSQWRDPHNALGPAEGNTNDVTALGNGGVMVLTFDSPIKDGSGFDFAVFENGFSDDFIELAFVEVSSDGQHFVRFDSAYLGEDPVPQYGTQSPELISGLAGKYRVGFGTPFDLATLKGKTAVRQGEVDLQHITQVRIVDIIGDGSELDSFGHPIYDPTPTVGSAGFDLDAIGVLHN
ncbi:MAG TPA: hypothetical protein VL137_03455 [Polyangiaceae bacterium]|nr:hypothetical protein [Polyangiaceae bacterium]